jgi:hypothetical protein
MPPGRCSSTTSGRGTPRGLPLPARAGLTHAPPCASRLQLRHTQSSQEAAGACFGGGAAKFTKSQFGGGLPLCTPHFCMPAGQIAAARTQSTHPCNFLLHAR